MKILIQILSVVVTITYAGVAIAIIMILINKMIYHPPAKQKEAEERASRYHTLFGICLFLSIVCTLGSKQLIKNDFHQSLKESKIISLEANGFFYGQEDVADLFTNFESDPGRFHCTSYPGIITLENNEIIPIEIIQHCCEENKYIIVSKKYSMDATIGIISTFQFDYMKNNNQQ